jgi:hypothetical protein
MTHFERMRQDLNKSKNAVSDLNKGEKRKTESKSIIILYVVLLHPDSKLISNN